MASVEYTHKQLYNIIFNYIRDCDWDVTTPRDLKLYLKDNYNISQDIDINHIINDILSKLDS